MASRAAVKTGSKSKKQDQFLDLFFKKMRPIKLGETWGNGSTREFTFLRKTVASISENEIEASHDLEGLALKLAQKAQIEVSYIEYKRA